MTCRKLHLLPKQTFPVAYVDNNTKADFKMLSLPLVKIFKKELDPRIQVMN